MDICHKQLYRDDEKSLKELASRLKEDCYVVEIGCWTGYSTGILAEVVKQKNGRMCAIDTFKGEGSHLEEVAKYNNIFKYFTEYMESLGVGDYVSVMKGRSDKVVDVFDDGSIDLLFIDGDHRYSQVSKDIELWMPKIKPDGILCGHDYEGGEFDEKYIEEDYVDGKHHGVCKAVQENFGIVEIFDNSTIWGVEIED